MKMTNFVCAISLILVACASLEAPAQADCDRGMTWIPQVQCTTNYATGATTGDFIIDPWPMQEPYNEETCDEVGPCGWTHVVVEQFNVNYDPPMFACLHRGGTSRHMGYNEKAYVRSGIQVIGRYATYTADDGETCAGCTATQAMDHSTYYFADIVDQDEEIDPGCPALSP